MKIKSGIGAWMILPFFILNSCVIIKEGISYNAVMKEIRSIKPEFYSREKVSFGPHPRQYFNVYRPEEVTQNRVIYYIHGGGWKEGSPEDYEFLAKFFTDRGYTVVLPAYRLVPDFRFESIRDDIFRGFSEADTYLRKDGSQPEYILSGSSAGAHLASLLCLDSSMRGKYRIRDNSFKAFISFAGVLDLEKCQRGILKGMISKLTENSLEDFRAANPVTYLENGERIPVYLFHSSSDGIADFENALSFQAKARQKDFSCELIELENMTHDQSYTDMFLGQTPERKRLSEILTSLE